jgi:8-amino-7-oxononanoate synthase
MDLDSLLAAELARLESAHLRRRLRVPNDDGTPLLDFASNDYLGMRRHSALIEAARQATERLGTGAGASRLVSGTDPAVVALEAELAAWKQKEAALIFSSGYAAALGTIPALVGRGDTVILDKLSHASLIDAARLSGATVRTFRHNCPDRLNALLTSLDRAAGRRLVITESIFSMDGDAAPLREIVAIKERHGAWLLVDEAHATGLYGLTGAGLLEELGFSGRVEVILATLSKAMGGIGGVIAGSRVLIDWLVNRARSFVYSTALPPGAIAASQAAVWILKGPEGSALRATLRDRIKHFRTHLTPRWPASDAATGAIQPLLCGEAEAALRLSQGLRDAGFHVPAIRYPTVPRGAARLRVTLSSAHPNDEIDHLLRALEKLG